MSAQSDLRILDSFVILVDCYAVYVRDTAFGIKRIFEMTGVLLKRNGKSLPYL